MGNLDYLRKINAPPTNNRRQDGKRSFPQQKTTLSKQVNKPIALVSKTSYTREPDSKQSKPQVNLVNHVGNINLHSKIPKWIRPQQGINAKDSIDTSDTSSNDVSTVVSSSKIPIFKNKVKTHLKKPSQPKDDRAINSVVSSHESLVDQLAQQRNSPSEKVFRPIAVYSDTNSSGQSEVKLSKPIPKAPRHENSIGLHNNTLQRARTYLVINAGDNSSKCDTFSNDVSRVKLLSEAWNVQTKSESHLKKLCQSKDERPADSVVSCDETFDSETAYGRIMMKFLEMNNHTIRIERKLEEFHGMLSKSVMLEEGGYLKREEYPNCKVLPLDERGESPDVLEDNFKIQQGPETQEPRSLRAKCQHLASATYKCGKECLPTVAMSLAVGALLYVSVRNVRTGLVRNGWRTAVTLLHENGVSMAKTAAYWLN